jgi:murein DD-endopeptidase MepM/ murein hydrolase activator NlpD
MKFFSLNKNKRTSDPKTFSKGFFVRTIGSFVVILSLILNIFVTPAVAHAGFFSSIEAAVSGGVSDLGPNHANADDISDVSSTTSTTSGDEDDDSVLVAAVNSDLTPTPDCSVPVTDDTISSQLDPCSAATTTNTEISTYTVRSGDTLSEIANIFGVSVNTIVWVNDLDRNAPLQTGETLVILPVSGIQYMVKKGDTVQSVATHYGVDPDEIYQYNDITASSTLNPGDTIIIPDAALEGTSPSSSGSGSASTVKTSGAKGGIPPKSEWGAPGTEPAHDTNGPSYPGYYDLPLAHGVETQGLHGYNAVDLAAPKGTPILAAADGTVIISIKNGGWNGGYGNYVVINHPNGTQTLYAHMSKVIATVGETVTQGETIGLVGATGEATGPHVHFEVHGARNPFANVGTW